MSPYVALLRAVNVTGTGALPMAELKAMCERVGFGKVRTYIASGNVVFLASGDEREVKAALEAELFQYAGKPVAVFVRTPLELAEVLAADPFPHAAGNRTMAFFLDEAPPSDALDRVTHRVDEEIRLGYREIYVHYPNGQGQSRLKIPAAAVGTARNRNTIAKLVQLATAL